MSPEDKESMRHSGGGKKIIRIIIDSLELEMRGETDNQLMG